MDYYELLSVRQDATDEEIRKAYRRLVRNHHPDYSGQADAAEFRKIQEAYETLSDPARRAAYDRELEGEIPVHVVSRSRSQTVYEIHPRGHHPGWGGRRFRREPLLEEALFEELERFWRRFFGF